MKAVLFDFGGTIDTNGVHWSEMYRGAFTRAGAAAHLAGFDAAFVESERRLVADPATAQSTFRQALTTQAHTIAGILGVNESAADDVAGECYAEVRRTIAHARPLLAAFAKRYTLGLVSNFYGNLGIVCGEFGLDKLFAAAIDSAVEGVRKPDPGIFSIALSRLGAAAGETFVVGDSYERDIVPAKSLGCATVWLRGRSWTVPKETGAADYTITSFEATRAILLP